MGFRRQIPCHRIYCDKTPYALIAHLPPLWFDAHSFSVAFFATCAIIFTPTRVKQMALLKWNFTLAGFKDVFTDNAFMFLFVLLAFCRPLTYQ